MEVREGAEKKKKRDWQKWAGMAALVLMGAACGVLTVLYSDSVMQGETLAERLMESTVFAFGALGALYLQMIIHEAGHLVCGMLSGYRFSSFRIGGWMWIKKEGRIVFKRFSLAGTGGQCLMAPPDPVEGKFPFRLYNLGGVLLNIGAGLLCLGLAAVCRNVAYLHSFLLFMSVIGLVFALTNGIPLRLGGVDNDGYNVLSLGKNAEAAHSFWTQLRMNEGAARGMRLKDMPRKWLYMPSDEGMKNSVVATMGVMYCNLLMDTHLFAEAALQMDKCLEMDSGIVGLHRYLLHCDRMYCELMGENRKERLDALWSREQKKFMRSMRNFPSVRRTEYACALLAEKDAGRAEKVKAAFEARARTYPYPGEIESERELMCLAEERARQAEAG